MKTKWIMGVCLIPRVEFGSTFSALKRARPHSDTGLCWPLEKHIKVHRCWTCCWKRERCNGGKRLIRYVLLVNGTLQPFPETILAPRSITQTPGCGKRNQDEFVFWNSELCMHRHEEEHTTVADCMPWCFRAKNRLWNNMRSWTTSAPWCRG